MDDKCVKQNNGFDYLSFLINGFIDNTNNYNNNNDIIQIDVSSDSESSDDCLIVDFIKNSSTDVNKTNAKDMKSSHVKKHLVEKEVKSEQKSNKLDVKTEVMDKHLKPFDNKNDLKMNGNKIKTKLKRNLFNDLKTCDSKAMIEKKINCFVDKSSIDVRLFDFELEKINDIIIGNDLIDCKKSKNQISVQTEDIGTDLLVEKKQSSSYQSSCDMSYTDREILTAIGRILSQKQQPVFDCLFVMCSELVNTCPQFGTRIGFMSAINEAKRKGFIQEYSSIDGTILYRGINSGLDFVSSILKRKSSINNRISSCSNSFVDVSEFDFCSNKYSNSQSFEHETINPKKRRYYASGQESENSDSVAINYKKELKSSANTQLLFEGEFEDLGNLDDGYDFDDIDVSNSGPFADTEVDPKILLNFAEDSSIIKENPFQCFSNRFQISVGNVVKKSNT